MIICGIDPGLNGGLAFLDAAGEIVDVAIMPTIGKPTTVDASGVVDLLKRHRPALVLLEKSGPRPGQGVTSMFTFGVGFGVVKGVTVALGIPLELVPPRTWMKGLGLASGPPGHAKARTLAHVRSRWPDAAIIPPRCRVPHTGLVDALAICEFGRLRSVMRSRVG